MTALDRENIAVMIYSTTGRLPKYVSHINSGHGWRKKNNDYGWHDMTIKMSNNVIIMKGNFEDCRLLLSYCVVIVLRSVSWCDL